MLYLRSSDRLYIYRPENKLPGLFAREGQEIPGGLNDHAAGSPGKPPVNIQSVRTSRLSLASFPVRESSKTCCTLLDALLRYSVNSSDARE
jgi:hypothetical protein